VIHMFLQTIATQAVTEASSVSHKYKYKIGLVRTLTKTESPWSAVGCCKSNIMSTSAMDSLSLSITLSLTLSIGFHSLSFFFHFYLLSFFIILLYTDLF
ncbi:hypothetical protein QHH03_30370, partial [Aphanizomenon sp. 202]|nr:hypothetical protein [Aphanizomenon sp. 202]